MSLIFLILIILIGWILCGAICYRVLKAFWLRPTKSIITDKMYHLEWGGKQHEMAINTSFWGPLGLFCAILLWLFWS
jgi:hypothetical protein